MLPWQVLRFAMNWEEMKILSERCRLFVTKALKCNISILIYRNYFIILCYPNMLISSEKDLTEEIRRRNAVQT